MEYWLSLSSPVTLGSAPVNEVLISIDDTFSKADDLFWTRVLCVILTFKFPVFRLVRVKEGSIMQGCTKGTLVFVMVALLVCTTTGSSALAQEVKLEEEPTAEGMIIDFVLLRPMGILSTAVGTVFFIASLPFSAPTGSTGVAFHELVEEPASFAFARPLGEVNY
jgi:branched-subunit amino acid transport protein AzlD